MLFVKCLALSVGALLLLGLAALAAMRRLALLLNSRERWSAGRGFLSMGRLALLLNSRERWSAGRGFLSMGRLALLLNSRERWSAV